MRPTGPFGAKSIGEIVINTPAPAITQAIYPSNRRLASRVTDFAGTYPACETGGITILCDYLHIQPGLTAIIGGGGKTTLLRVLANELSAQARVIVATSTKMMTPEWCPALIDPSLGEVQKALQTAPWYVLVNPRGNRQDGSIFLGFSPSC